MALNSNKRKNLLIPAVHNPDEFYTISELTQLLGEKKRFKRVVYNWLVPHHLFDRFETVQDGERIQEPIIYQGVSGLGIKSCYILKKAVPSFVQAHQSELEQMGISSDIIHIVGHDLTRIEKYSDEDYIRLWDLAIKFTRNSKSVQSIVDYIYQNLLTATYATSDETGNKTSQNMFVTWVPTQGTPRFFLKKEALSAFMEQFGSILKQTAQQIDKETDVVSLRYLGRQLCAEYVLLDSELKQFIEAKCLDDTYVETDEKGRKHVKKIFEIGKRRELHIQKKGIPTFVRKHQSELQSLGLNSVSHVADGVQKISKPKDMYTIQQLATRLGGSRKYDVFYNWFTQHLMNATVEKTHTNGEVSARRLFVPYLWNGEKRYYITKKDLKTAIYRYRSEFLEMGAVPEILDELAGMGKVRKKTPQMIPFYRFYQMLSSPMRYHTDTTKMIMERFAHETYTETDKQGVLFESPVFERVQAGPIYTTVFRNKKAMLSFVSKHRDFLEEQGINRFLIQDLLGEKAVEHMSDDLIPLSDLRKELYCADYNIVRCIKEKYLDETYPTTNESGESVEKSMFVWAGIRNKGVGCICIRKDALPYLAERHQEEFKLRPIVVDELCGRIHIMPKTPDLLSANDVCILLGKNHREARHTFGDVFNNICFDDMVVSDDKQASKQSTPMFTYARRSDNGHVFICIRQEGLIAFLKKYASQLGITDIHLRKARHYLGSTTTQKSIVHKAQSQHTL